MSFMRRVSRGLSHNVTCLSKCYLSASLHTETLSVHLHRQSLTSRNKCYQTRNMHLLQFTYGGTQHIGVKVDSENVLSVTDFVPELPNNVCAALQAGPEKLIDAAKRSVS